MSKFLSQKLIYMYVYCLFVCIHSFITQDSVCRWNVYEIGDPYLLYRIKVKVDQLIYTQQGAHGRQVWDTVGEATVGPERIGNAVDSDSSYAPHVS